MPLDKLFPVLDVLRLLVLHNSSIAFYSNVKST